MTEASGESASGDSGAGQSARIRRLSAERLVLRATDPRLEAVVQTARSSLDRPPTYPLPPFDACCVGLGALALGHADVATAMLRRLLTAGDALAVLLGGRHLAATGDLAIAAAVVETARPAAAAGRLDARTLARLSGMASDVGSPLSTGPSAAEGSAAEHWHPLADSMARALAAARFEEATRIWGEAADSALGRDSPAAEWGSLVDCFVHGILGAEPDAPRQRIVLRPRLPRTWEFFEALRLQVGDAAVDVRYERQGSTHRFRVEQERGAVPLQLILQPAVAGAEPVATRVDGVPAALKTSRSGDRLVVPVQLALDSPRTLDIDAAPPPS